MEYYSPANVPATDAKSQDYWGYNNGITTNSTLLPAVSPVDYPQIAANIAGANRAPVLNAAITGILKKIIYPTGGTSTFIYENNDYGFDENGPVAETQHISGTSSAAAVISSTVNIPSQTKTFSIPQYQNIKVAMSSSVVGPAPVDNGPTMILNQINTNGSRTNIITLYSLTASSTKYVLLNPGNYEIIASVDGTGQSASINAYYYTLGSAIKTILCGGVRIKQIINSDSITGTNNITELSYYMKDDPGRSSGTVFSIPQFIELKEGYLVRSSYTSNYLATTQGSAVGYAFVTETQISASGTNTGKKEYYFNTNTPNQNGIIPFAVPLGVSPTVHFLTGMPDPKKLITDFDVYRGNLLREAVYNSQQVLLKETVSSYNIDSAFNSNSLNYFALSTRRGGSFDFEGPQAGLNSNYRRPYYTKAMIVCPWIYKTQEVVRLYDINGLNPIETNTKFYYEKPYHAMVTKIETTNSKEDTLKTTNTYPGDYPGITVYDSMVAANMISPVIESNYYTKNVFTSKSVTNYKQWNISNRIIAPQTIQSQIGNYPIEIRVQFNKYDVTGNIMEQQKSNDVKQSYLYDYKNYYPVAEVINADSASIAYTSFEAGGLGNWVNTDTARNRVFSLTGSQCYNLVTGKSFTKSVASGTAYIVSYWSRNGAVTVTANGAGTTATPGLKKNGWTYYEHSLPNTTTSVSVIAISTLVDELRLYPSAAQMTTYTYIPLVGISSTCSANNTVLYYEYDGFNRLSVIRDMDKNIVKQIDYQYQLSPIN